MMLTYHWLKFIDVPFICMHTNNWYRFNCDS